MTDDAVPLKEYFERILQERERRFDIQREDTAEALRLARTIQDYKDEKANELRSQIERERGNYATKDDLIKSIEKVEEMVRPISNWMAAQQGKSSGYNSMWAIIVSVVALAGAILTLLLRM